MAAKRDIHLLPIKKDPIMDFNLPIRSADRSTRNEESRNHFLNYTPTSSTEAIGGPIREFAPVNDRLVVGLDFGTTYSG